MIQLAYLSSATPLFTPPVLMALLTKSRERNHSLNITGMLLYKDGNVMQVLEGESKAVQELFGVISKDRRHHGIIQLYEKEITERDFPDWSMGFYDLDTPEARMHPGFSEFLDPKFDLKKQKPSAAAKLMAVFKSSLR